MIDRIEGALSGGDAQVLCIRLPGGITLSLETPKGERERLGSKGEPVTVLTELVVGETAWKLLGFATEDRRDLYRQIIRFDGVGPMLALKICGAGEADEIRGALEAGNAAFFKGVSGLGPKTIQKICFQAKGKLGGGKAPSEGHGFAGLATAALETLGYTKQQAKKRVEDVMRSGASVSTAEDLIRLALKGG